MKQESSIQEAALNDASERDLNQEPAAEAVQLADDAADGKNPQAYVPTSEEIAARDAWEARDRRVTALSLSVHSTNLVRSDAEILARADVFANYIAG